MLLCIRSSKNVKHYFPSSTTPHPISILPSSSSSSSSSPSLHRSTFPLSSHSLFSPPISLSPRLSQDTHPTTSVRPIPFVVPTDLPESVLHRSPPPTNTHPMVTRSKARIYKPKTLVAALDFLVDLALF
ncbi:hypothetical protein AAG906_009276 [Vitis piasezkii]